MGTGRGAASERCDVYALGNKSLEEKEEKEKRNDNWGLKWGGVCVKLTCKFKSSVGREK